MSEIKRMSISEFREFGFLQEVNRCFLHPLGLALEVVVETVTNADDEEVTIERLGGIWDYRDDPEGMAFGDNLDWEKAVRVAALRAEKSPARQERLGYVIQPVPGPGDEER